MKQSHISTAERITTDELISQCYSTYLTQIKYYISSRIENKGDVSDIAQDAYVRLIEYKQMLRPETIKSFIFTIVKNLVIDYNRKQYKKIEISANNYEFTKEYQDSVESQIFADDLLRLENSMIIKMPKQRKLVYAMSRFSDKSPEEIAGILQISKRTAENHLFVGRKTMREYLQNCI